MKINPGFLEADKTEHVSQDSNFCIYRGTDRFSQTPSHSYFALAFILQNGQETLSLVAEMPGEVYRRFLEKEISVLEIMVNPVNGVLYKLAAHFHGASTMPIMEYYVIKVEDLDQATMQALGELRVR